MASLPLLLSDDIVVPKPKRRRVGHATLPVDNDSDEVVMSKPRNTTPPINSNNVDDEVVTPKPKVEYDTPAISDQLLAIERRMCEELDTMQFVSPVTHVYNPLHYAAETHECYVCRYGNSRKRVVFLGMNPGPFGMAQNGVPFGDSTHAKEWLQISGTVHKPLKEHPKRPIHGLACKRHEVSGSRFWGLMQTLCKDPDVFFRNCYVHNYCPLCLMAASGKNITPPMLKKEERKSLQEVCDRFLVDVVDQLEVEWLVAVGKYAESRAKLALKGHGREVKIFSITHPSPINPAANQDWASLVTSQLAERGVLEIVKGRA